MADPMARKTPKLPPDDTIAPPTSLISFLPLSPPLREKSVKNIKNIHDEIMRWQKRCSWNGIQILFLNFILHLFTDLMPITEPNTKPTVKPRQPPNMAPVFTLVQHDCSGPFAMTLIKLEFSFTVELPNVDLLIAFGSWKTTGIPH